MGCRVIFCLNSGSSSRKFAIYQLSDGEEILLAQGVIERMGSQDARLWIGGPENEVEMTSTHLDESEAALREAFAQLERLKLPPLEAVGNRVVHGGLGHEAPERITDTLIGKLRSLVSFAPLHLPDEMAGIEAVAALFPGLPQVACFDTAFDRQMPEVAKWFALPRSLWEEGIRGYGFHSISYEYVMQILGNNPPSRLVIAHFGNGSSMAAVKDGRPLDTTIGFSPSGGFMMGTRSGDLDPGIVLYLLYEKHLDPKRLEQLVNYQSGLLGLSSISSDMKTLLERRDAEPHAAQAVEMSCYQIRKNRRSRRRPGRTQSFGFHGWHR